MSHAEPPLPPEAPQAEGSGSGSAESSVVSAYAALNFVDPPFTFYLKTLSVTIGRRPTPLLAPDALPLLSAAHARPRASLSATRSTSPAEAQAAVKQEDTQDDVPDGPPLPASQVPQIHVDVDLGPIKAVSRDHARVYYDYDLASWALQVRGRNGVVVTGRWLAKGEIARLGKRTKIQIAERIFYFVLPDGAESNVTDYESITSVSEGESLQSSADSDPEESFSDAYTPHLHPNRSKRNVKRPAHLAHDYTLSAAEDPDGQQTKKRGKQAKPEFKIAPPPKPKNTKNKKNVRRTTADGDETMEKPPFSYASLVAQAIDQAAPVRGLKKLTSAAICEWISIVFPYYAKNPDGLAWQNSIQQALSNNVIFIKVPRQEDEPGKGNFWTMDQKYIYLFDGQHLTQLTNKDAPKNVTKSRTSTRTIKASEKAQAALHEGDPATPPATRISARQEKKKSTTDNGPPTPSASAAAPSAQAATEGQGSQPPEGTPAKAATPAPPVKIVIGPPPADWTAPTYTDEPKTELHRLIRQENPIILHNGVITLSPVVFKSMKPQELENFTKLERDATLKLLQQYMVEHFKHEIKKAKKGNKRKAEDGAPGDAAIKKAKASA